MAMQAMAIRPLPERAAGLAKSVVAQADDGVSAWLALGANLGDAQETLRQAVAAMHHWPHTQVVAASSFYRTAPVDASGPDYINAVIELHTALSPTALLEHCQCLEKAAGRERPYRHAPRTLDIDILLYADWRVASPELTVPHPRMAQRAFVLVPLAEIAPEKVTAAQLDAVAGQRIERLAAHGLPPAQA